MRIRIGLGCLAVAFVSVSGCGGAAKNAPPPTPEAKPPPAHQPLSELDALEHDLDVANQRLALGLERKVREKETDQSSIGQDAQASANKPPAQTQAQPEKPKGEEAPADEPRASTEPSSSGLGRAGSPCDVACRALGSMKRSADKICELAGESNERCTRAREKVRDAEARVKNAGCACHPGEALPPAELQSRAD